jgi:hypothetical protein
MHNNFGLVTPFFACATRLTPWEAFELFAHAPTRLKSVIGFARCFLSQRDDDEMQANLLSQRISPLVPKLILK